MDFKERLLVIKDTLIVWGICALLTTSFLHVLINIWPLCPNICENK